MLRSNILKYGLGIQLYTSGILLAIAIIIYLSSSKFVNAQTLIGILLLALFIQSLLVPVLVFKIISLKKLIVNKLENDKVLSFCNSIFISYQVILNNNGNLYKETGNNIEEEHKNLESKSSAILLEKANATESKLKLQNIALSKATDLQSKILNPQLDWWSINEGILSSLTKNLEVTTEKTIVFQVNSSPKSVKLDIDSLTLALETILEAVSKHYPEGTTLEVSTEFQKSLLKITFIIDNYSFSKNKFQNMLNKNFNRKYPNIFREGMGVSLLEGYLKVNHGQIAFKDYEKEGCSELFLLFDLKELAIKKVHKRSN